MSESPYIFEVDESNFAALVLDRSHERPVLVDFWAEWCAPCRSLMPLLAKLAEEYRGEVLLAKVNSDENQALAARFGVRSLPTVKLFKNGAPVDEFMGALPEGAVREFLERHVERESEKLRSAAMRALRQGDREYAIEQLDRAHEMEPDNSAITVDLASVLAESDPARAEALLARLPDFERNEQPAAGLLARLELSRAVADLPDEATLVAGAEGGSLESLHQLALLLAARGDYAEAMERLLTILRKDRGYQDDLARKTLLKLFNMLGDDPLVDKYRRSMTNLLF